MVQQSTLASRDTAGLDFPTKPLVVLDRSAQQLQRDLIGIAPGFGGNLIQSGFKFRRDVQVHGVRVGVKGRRRPGNARRPLTPPIQCQ